MPKQINTYTFGAGLVRKFGLKGRYQPVLDEVIVPVTLVDETPGERLAVGGHIGTSAGAGNQNTIYFANPPTSGVLVRVDSFWAVSGAPTTDYFQISAGSGGIAVTSNETWRDRRLRGVPKAAFTGVQAGAIVLGVPEYHLDVDSRVWEQEWVLEPGDWMKFTQNALNTTFTVMAAWREINLTVTNAP